MFLLPLHYFSVLLSLPLSCLPSISAFLESLISKEILSHHGQFACLPGWKPRSRVPQPCITGSHRRGHGQHTGTANCRAKPDPSVLLLPSWSEFQPLSISAPSSNLAYSSAAISPLQVVILKGKEVGVRPGRERLWPNCSDPQRMWRSQHSQTWLMEVFEISVCVCAQWLCNSTLAKSVSRNIVCAQVHLQWHFPQHCLYCSVRTSWKRTKQWKQPWYLSIRIGQVN